MILPHLIILSLSLLILDLLRHYICLLKLSFLASLSLNFSTISLDMLSKFTNKSAQKVLIFPSKANDARGLLFSGRQKQVAHGTPSIHPTVQRVLETMPNLDREVLNSFFQLLSSDHNFSYTLFGNKPMSLADYASKVCSWSLCHPSESLIFEKGWERWESYAAFFPSHEFVLKRCKGSRSATIFLIHKKHALQVISDHLDAFQKILGERVYPQQLLQHLCDPSFVVERVY